MENWDDLRIFLAVARAEGLTGAGRALKMDPSTVGRRINRLEEHMGGALFAKSPQGYALTDLGVRTRETALLAERHLRGAFDGDETPEGRLSGQIRIGAPDGAANYLLPQVVEVIQADHPDLEVQILALPRVVNLSRREADMAITVSPPAAGRLTVQKIIDYHLHLATRADGPVIEDLSQLKDERIVGYIPDMIFDKELDYLGDLGASKVHLASNSASVQLQLVRRGGVGVVHDFAMPFAPELRQVLRQQVSLTRTFYLVRHTSDRHSERLNRFATALRRGMAAEVDRLERSVTLTANALI